MGQLKERISEARNELDMYGTPPSVEDLLDWMIEAGAMEDKIALFGDGHASDCATHNEPAYPNGPCDCKTFSPPSLHIGMGDEKPTIPQWIVLHAMTEWWNDSPIKGGAPDWKAMQEMLTKVADSCKFANAHTKSVSIDELMGVVEGVLSRGNYLDPVWGPNELKNMDKIMRAAFLKLTQQP